MPIFVLPSLEKGAKKLKGQILGGLEVGEEDPALTMDDITFLNALNSNKIYIGKLIEKEVQVK